MARKKNRTSFAGKSPAIFELFAGAGLMALGYEMENCSIKGALDIDPWAMKTFRSHFTSTHAACGSIEDKELMHDLVERFRGKVNVVSGGSPCQSFSMSGNRDTLERRAYFFVDFLDFVNAVEPEIFVFENVKAFKTMKIVPLGDVVLGDGIVGVKEPKLAAYLAARRKQKDLNRYAAQRALSEVENNELAEVNVYLEDNHFEPQLASLLETFVAEASKTYDVVYGVLRATDFGSGQDRERFICIGTRKGSGLVPSLPRPTGGARTCRQVIGDLENAPEGCLPNHEFARHAPFQIERMRALGYGERVYKQFSDAWRRLDPDKPSFCVKGNHGASAVHFSKPRILSNREMARLMNVADDFVFYGSKSQVMQQISNGVDVAVARAIAREVKEILAKRIADEGQPIVQGASRAKT